ncbi:MAG: hypothetical protein MI923_27035 [Phycisphaerales bacterium]|nr:hypothetical protein [Phycisphaerales bacterium]
MFDGTALKTTHSIMKFQDDLYIKASLSSFLLCCKAAAGGSLLSMALSPENMEFIFDKKTIVTAITLVDRECVKSSSISLEINADDFSHKWNSPLSIIDQICLWNYK